MPFPFALLVLGLPLMELAGLVVAGQAYGALPVLAWVVVSGVIGVQLMRISGWVAAQRMQEAMRGGQLPLVDMLTGAAMTFAGLLLIVPGFITDVLGILLLIAPLRRVLARAFVGGGMVQTTPTRRDDDVIEGEFTVVDDVVDPSPQPPAASPLPPPAASGPDKP